MLYSFVRPIAALGLRAFYRKIQLVHTERVPTGKPVILACNHPTAFIEPCLLACFMGRPLYFLVRGNLFQKKIYDALLRSLNMLPIFRLKDGGYGKLKNNFDTFSAVFDALKRNRTVMILSEGSTIQCKRLRPLQKGTARLALGALEEAGLEEVYVVPVGVNFAYAERPRSEVMIEFGEPLKASDYLAAFRESANQGIVDLTTDLKPAMESCLVNLPGEGDEALGEPFLQMARSEHPQPIWPVVSGSPGRLELEKAVAHRIAALPQSAKPGLQKAADDYLEHLGQFGLTDEALYRRGEKIAGWPLALGAPLFWPLYSVHALLTRPGKQISENKVKTHEFIMPVRWAVNLGTYLAGTVVMGIAAAIAGSWAVLGCWAAFLLLGYLSLFYMEHLQRYRLNKRARQVPQSQLEQLLGRRAALKQLLQKAEVGVK